MVSRIARQMSRLPRIYGFMFAPVRQGVFNKEFIFNKVHNDILI